MTQRQQLTLGTKLNRDLREFMTREHLSPLAMMYFLVSFLWGWAKACQWKSPALLRYASEAFSACERAEAQETIFKVGQP